MPAQAFPSRTSRMGLSNMRWCCVIWSISSCRTLEIFPVDDSRDLPHTSLRRVGCAGPAGRGGILRGQPQAIITRKISKSRYADNREREAARITVSPRDTCTDTTRIENADRDRRTCATSVRAPRSDNAKSNGRTTTGHPARFLRGTRQSAVARAADTPPPHLSPGDLYISVPLFIHPTEVTVTDRSALRLRPLRRAFPIPHPHPDVSPGPVAQSV